jgi:hypothetical protein
MFPVFNGTVFSQAGRRGFEPRLPLHFFNKLQAVTGEKVQREQATGLEAGLLQAVVPRVGFRDAVAERQARQAASGGIGDRRRGVVGRCAGEEKGKGDSSGHV